MVTINKVAEEAGVSKSTVSRYISQKGYVSEEASEKIKIAIEKLRYIPNLSAQSLKTKKNQIVGLLLPDISNPFFPRLARGAETYLKEKGYRVMLGNISDNPETAMDYLNIMLQSNVSGIITTHDFTKEYPKLDIPVVVVDRVKKDTELGVFSDSIEGGRIAASRIIEGGAKQVLLIQGPLDNADNISERFEASLAKMNESGITTFISHSQSFDFEVIQVEAREALATFTNLDSIITPSDIHAIAYIHELHSMGRQIPTDVQVIGYDDILMSQFIYPPLSTIHQSSYQMGQKAAELVYKVANQQPIESKRIKLPVHYVERETVRRKYE